MYIPFNELVRIHDEFKDRNLSGYDLDRMLNNKFRTSYYKKYGCSVTDHQVLKIEEILNRKIIVTENKNYKTCEELEIEKNEDVAEIVGILLGDGCIAISKKKNGGNTYKVGIYIHENDVKIIDNVIRLFRDVFHEDVKAIKRNDSKCVSIYTCKKNTVLALVKIGMTVGNKVTNQVKVPDWIKDDEKYIVKCLRGMVDTDGSIYIRNSQDTVEISFSNRSIPLLEDFQWLCNQIGVQSHRTGNLVNIGSKKEVKKFIDIVQPVKWLMKLDENENIAEKLEYKNK